MQRLPDTEADPLQDKAYQLLLISMAHQSPVEAYVEGSVVQSAIQAVHDKGGSRFSALWDLLSEEYGQPGHKELMEFHTMKCEGDEDPRQFGQRLTARYEALTAKEHKHVTLLDANSTFLRGLPQSVRRRMNEWTIEHPIATTSLQSMIEQADVIFNGLGDLEVRGMYEAGTVGTETLYDQQDTCAFHPGSDHTTRECKQLRHFQAMGSSLEGGIGTLTQEMGEGGDEVHTAYLAAHDFVRVPQGPRVTQPQSTAPMCECGNHRAGGVCWVKTPWQAPTWTKAYRRWQAQQRGHNIPGQQAAGLALRDVAAERNQLAARVAALELQLESCQHNPNPAACVTKTVCFVAASDPYNHTAMATELPHSFIGLPPVLRSEEVIQPYTTHSATLTVTPHMLEPAQHHTSATLSGLISLSPQPPTPQAPTHSNDMPLLATLELAVENMVQKLERATQELIASAEANRLILSAIGGRDEEEGHLPAVEQIPHPASGSPEPNIPVSLLSTDLGWLQEYNDNSRQLTYFSQDGDAREELRLELADRSLKCPNILLDNGANCFIFSQGFCQDQGLTWHDIAVPLNSSVGTGSAVGRLTSTVDLVLRKGCAHEARFRVGDGGHQVLVTKGGQHLYDVLLGAPFIRYYGGAIDSLKNTFTYCPFLQSKYDVLSKAQVPLRLGLSLETDSTSVMTFDPSTCLTHVLDAGAEEEASLRNKCQDHRERLSSMDEKYFQSSLIPRLASKLRGVRVHGHGLWDECSVPDTLTLVPEVAFCTIPRPLPPSPLHWLKGSFSDRQPRCLLGGPLCSSPPMMRH